MSVNLNAEIEKHAMDAVQNVIPVPVLVGSTTPLTAPFEVGEIGVLIGLAGQFPRQMILTGPKHVFSALSQVIFGMALEGDLLASFIGEVGNMVAGSTATRLSQNNMLVDISPPTVLEGQTKLTGFQRGTVTTTSIDGVGHLDVVLVME